MMDLTLELAVRTELYDISYIIAWKTAGPNGVVRYFVQNRLRNGRTEWSCTIFRTKSLEKRPDRMELYDISYKIAWKTAGPNGVVRYFVQNRLENGRIEWSCTIFRTKSLEKRPDRLELYDISYKLAWKTAGPNGVVRYFVQNRLRNGRTAWSCTIFRTKPLEKRTDRLELYDISYKIAWKMAGPLGVVRYFIQTRLENGRTTWSCTIFHKKSPNRPQEPHNRLPTTDNRQVHDRSRHTARSPNRKSPGGIRHLFRAHAYDALSYSEWKGAEDPHADGNSGGFPRR